MKKNTWKRILSAICAVFFFAFGCDLGETKFCLGDVILNKLGIPVWSRGTQGIHYPAIIGLIGLMAAFYVFASTTKDPKRTMGNLFLATVALLSLLSMLI